MGAVAGACESRRNRTGLKGVTQHGNKWQVAYKGKYRGQFSSPEEAAAAYNKACLESPPCKTRTCMPNKMEVQDDELRIYLAGGKVAIADARWHATLSNFRWELGTHGYVVTSWRSKSRCYWLRLHHLVMYLSGKQWEEVDHRNLDKLDNRQASLRPATRQQNAQNVKTRARSGFKGVYRDGNRWQARYRGEYFGLFLTPEEAARASDRAAYAFAKEFAFLNFPDDIELYAAAGPPALKHRTSRSGVKGVRQRGSRWEATYGRQYLGVFPSAEEAAEARNKAAMAGSGDAAYLNILDAEAPPDAA